MTKQNISFDKVFTSRWNFLYRKYPKRIEGENRKHHVFNDEPEDHESYHSLPYGYSLIILWICNYTTPYQ